MIWLKDGKGMPLTFKQKSGDLLFGQGEQLRKIRKDLGYKSLVEILSMSVVENPL